MYRFKNATMTIEVNKTRTHILAFLVTRYSYNKFMALTLSDSQLKHYMNDDQTIFEDMVTRYFRSVMTVAIVQRQT